ncbi:hypothetical protein J8273_2608 [Carpediemonas membranifera]|uniref:Uncharacterized protein n=1 Tax=Carpediemonas membranifera TaxID=201153 RepID=A0A8J6B9V4_9EUKA|nr:hypothetical protein J8273_2608 [Carpediemonas membranifera]|eukprot:KAG9396254.1 hypothetical protein J8273_2608 [Carpediemonas membranifera]
MRRHAQPSTTPDTTGKDGVASPAIVQTRAGGARKSELQALCRALSHHSKENLCVRICGHIAAQDPQAIDDSSTDVDSDADVVNDAVNDSAVNTAPGPHPQALQHRRPHPHRKPGPSSSGTCQEYQASLYPR